MFNDFVYGALDYFVFPVLMHQDVCQIKRKDSERRGICCGRGEDPDPTPRSCYPKKGKLNRYFMHCKTTIIFLTFSNLL